MSKKYNFTITEDSISYSSFRIGTNEYSEEQILREISMLKAKIAYLNDVIKVNTINSQEKIERRKLL